MDGWILGPVRTENITRIVQGGEGVFKGKGKFACSPEIKTDMKTQEDTLVKQTVPVYESTLLQWSSTQSMFLVEHAQKNERWT